MLPKLCPWCCVLHKALLGIQHPVVTYEQGYAGQAYCAQESKCFWVCAAAVYACRAPLKSHSSSWEAFRHPVWQLHMVHAGQGYPALQVLVSHPTYMCLAIKISNNPVTTVVWFSALLLNICWAFLAQRGRALSWFMACLVLTTSEIPAINMFSLESKPITGVSAAYNYTHGLVLILCQLIITANLCIFKVIYCHKDEPDDLISTGFMIQMMYSNWC